jgi:hypothetical protein
VSRWLPLACIAVLAGLIARDLWLLWDAAPAVESVPLFTPASLGTRGQPEARCQAPGPPPDPASAKIPLEALLALAPAHRPEVGAALDAVFREQEKLRTLRNQRHAWNVEAMKLTAALARGIDPEQLAWILDNRDAVAAMPLPAEAWGALGLAAP